MQYRPALLQTLAAAAWTATIIGAFTGYDDNLRDYSALDERIWFCALGVAVVTSLPVVFGSQVAGRIDRFYAAISKTALTRPRDAGPQTGPLPAAPGAPSVPFPAISMDRYRQHGKHANRG